MDIAEQDDDEAGWLRMLDGDGEALGAIYDRHSQRVARHAARLVTNPVDVDDVVAIVFLEAWRNREKVRFVDGSLLPWLLVTATNASRNLERSVRRHRALIAKMPAAFEYPDVVENDDAQRAMRSLSVKDQEVLTLCVILELSERETAAILGVAPGTVKSRLHYAKARLVKTMGADGPSSALNGVQS